MKLLPNAVTVKAARQILTAQKHSPTLLFGAGVVGVVGTTVLACKATLKLEHVLHVTQNNLHAANGMAVSNNPKYGMYTEHDRKKDVAIIYSRSAVEVAKLYAPAVVLGAVSIGALTASHNILSKRNVALTAAYAALEKGFDQYRERVVDKFGEEQDRQFRYGTEEVTVTDSKGKPKIVTRVSSDAPSIYAKFFDQMSANWNKQPEYNLIFLKAQQNYWNDVLKTRGHVFLNEVYKSLGLPHTGAGSLVGWVIGGEGDNFIDFGIWDDNQNARDFVNGREGAILLDFNVDGIVWDKIDDDRREEGIPWQS